ncbi:MAG: molecular chaperone [Novosphingobium sp.]|nr:molecular chaperone [Novosphingobium sp.]
MKRFYKDVSVEEADGGWQVLLDGRAIRTAGKNPQVVPSRALAEAMAQEWASQGDEIDTGAFMLRDLADYALDVASGDAREELAREIAAYANTDTLCYRADPDEPLYKRQREVWEPMLAEAENRYDARFERVSGIMHRPQPPETLDRMHGVVAAQDAFALAALRMLTSLSASLVIALAALEPDADPEALWQAANLEEDWQAEHWGSDAEALELRQTRLDAFALAMRFAAMARDGQQA